MAVSTRSFAVNALSMLALAVMQRGVGLISIFLLSRIMDPRGLGAYTFTLSSSQSVYGVVRLGADAGLHVSMAQLSLPRQRKQAEAVLGELLPVFLAIAVISTTGVLLLADIIAESIFGATELAPFLSASAALVASQLICQYCYTVLAGLNAFVVYAHVSWIASLLTAISTTSGAILYGTIGAVWGGVGGAVATAVALSVVLSKELKRLGVGLKMRIPGSTALSVLGVGFPFYLSGLFLIPTEFWSLGYLSRTSGMGAVGELRVIQSLMSLATVVPLALSGPLVSHLAARSALSDEGNAIILQLRVMWVLAILISVILATFWPLLIKMIFPGSFVLAKTEGALALLAFTPLMVGSVLTGALLASRRQSMLLLVGLLQSGVIAIASPPLISSYGLAGYLIVQTISAIVGLIVAALVLRRTVWRSGDPRWIAPLSFNSLAVAAVVVANYYLIGEEIVSRVIAGAGLLVSLAYTCLASVFTDDERFKSLELGRAAVQRLRRPQA